MRAGDVDRLGPLRIGLRAQTGGVANKLEHARRGGGVADLLHHAKLDTDGG